MEKHFKNEYGTATLTTLTPFMRVGDIKGSDYPDDIKFNIDTAEKLALITENRGIQIVAQSTKQFYVMLHESTSVAAVCHAELEYTSPKNPTKAIEDAAKTDRYIGRYL
jgi:hypothetical protein